MEDAKPDSKQEQIVNDVREARKESGYDEKVRQPHEERKGVNLNEIELPKREFKR